MTEETNVDHAEVNKTYTACCTLGGGVAHYDSGNPLPRPTMKDDGDLPCDPGKPIKLATLPPYSAGAKEVEPKGRNDPATGEKKPLGNVTHVINGRTMVYGMTSPDLDPDVAMSVPKLCKEKTELKGTKLTCSCAINTKLPADEVH